MRGNRCEKLYPRLSIITSRFFHVVKALRTHRCLSYWYRAIDRQEPLVVDLPTIEGCYPPYTYAGLGESDASIRFCLYMNQGVRRLIISEE